ncbi:MAG: L-fuconolactonase [Blastocatellia bacterium]|nr:L-fuconolactonase [Blastocatellia bacterium]
MSPSIVDSHQHFWQVGRFDYPWMSPQLGVLYQDYLPPAIEPVLRQSGVSQTVLVQASNSLAETHWLLSLADAYSFIGGVVGWVDLMSADVGRQIDEFVAHPMFKGVRHLVESEPNDDWLNQSTVMRGLSELAARGVSYDLLVHTRHLKYACRVAEQCPGLRLVIDHMAKPPIARGEISEWAGELKQVAAYANVSCKLSGLATEADWKNWRPGDLRPYVEKALEYFGPQRLMFGSDWPVCLSAAAYNQVLESTQSLLADMSEEDSSRIFERNARDFYRLG